jgi:RNA polymerase sigma factor (sigma-70 family)
MPSEEDLALLSQLVHRIGRRRGLRRDDLHDFAQTVHLRLLETRYAAFDRFRGQASLKTYLTVVVTRLLHDWRIQHWGKWRPSAAALRLGREAIQLERLTSRDGFTVDEAIEICRTAACVPSATDLRHIAERLPSRQRRRMTTAAALSESPALPFDDPVERRERSRIRNRITAALDAALAELADDDRKLIETRYRNESGMSSIAASMNVGVKLLYRRRDHTLKALRRKLTAAGVVGPRHVRASLLHASAAQRPAPERGVPDAHPTPPRHGCSNASVRRPILAQPADRGVALPAAVPTPSPADPRER